MKPSLQRQNWPKFIFLSWRCYHFEAQRIDKLVLNIIFFRLQRNGLDYCDEKNIHEDVGKIIVQNNMFLSFRCSFVCTYLLCSVESHSLLEWIWTSGSSEVGKCLRNVQLPRLGHGQRNSEHIFASKSTDSKVAV